MRYQQLYFEAQDEIKRLKGIGDAVNRLRAHLTMLDAALRVLMKHDLLSELASEHCRIADAVDDPTDTGSVT